MALSGPLTYPPAVRRMRLGFVGGGRGALVGRWHAAGARLSDRWEIVAGALSSDPETAIASGRDWMLSEDRVYSNYRLMAEAEARRADGIDAVAICTPNHMHRPIAEAFMRAGIDVICDKPIATSLDDARRLLALQRENGLVFAVTYPYAFHPMVRQAREMVAAGAVGEISQFTVEYAQDWATEPEDPGVKAMQWRRDPARVGRASATGDIGTHAFHLLEFVTQRSVARLRADFHVCGAPKAMEDTAFLNLHLDNGAPGSMWLTQAAPGNYCALSFRIFGHRGGIAWDQERPQYLRYTPTGAPEQTIVCGHGAGMAAAAERMVRLPRGHGEALSDAWANLYRETAIVIEARRAGTVVPDGLVAVPGIEDGVRGVAFIHAAADSNDAGGVWTALESPGT